MCKANGLNTKRNIFDGHHCKIIGNKLNTCLSCVGYRQMIEKFMLEIWC